MKKVVLSMIVALVTTVSIHAQQIAVVSGSSTTTYKTLAAAIEAAPDGSVIYLPGGGFPISDEVKITKKLTFIGIGYNSESDNADGRTQLSGNLWFNAGSDGSAVMGCYINGNVYVGEGDALVNDIYIKYCNLNSVQVLNSSCLGTEVNQNLIRDTSIFNFAPAIITNNVLHSLWKINDGIISNNIFTSYHYGGSCSWTFRDCNDCVINYNVLLNPSCIHVGSNCQATGNMLRRNTWGDSSINVEVDDWAEVFVNNAGVNPISSYHFKDAYQEYETLCGLYGGTGFSDGQLPPVPYISNKTVPTETDSSGNLHINITVNAK